MKEKIVTIDIETENTGYDILNDNKRIISVQLLDDEGKFFYDGSEKNDLSSAKKEIQSCIENKKQFTGFNIRDFDIPMIKKFLDVEIPSSQINEICEMEPVKQLKQKLGKRKISLFQVCNSVGIDAGHKQEMNQLAGKFMDSPGVFDLAKEGAAKWETELGWGYDFSLKLARQRIAGGMAIIESFKDFVRSGGDETKLFYRYAMKDVEVENQLYHRLLQM